jgi:Pregnancy-associated plasma protein-A
LKKMKKEDPKAYDKFMKLEQLTNDYIQRISSSNPADRLINDNGTITIPVVVHVIHSGQALGTGRNIPDQQIFNQIGILNEDFNRLNADRLNTPAVFQGGNVNIRFVLACRDPNGAFTTGINRFQSGTANFSVNGNTSDSPAKHANQGGVDAWPTDRYLNIWVCSLTGGVLGAAPFPSDYTLRPNIDGLIIHFEAFGSGGNSRAPFDLGRTATHEIGHWLNLIHIWGDEAACSGTDNCNDTPNQGDFTPPGITPVFPNRTSCGNSGDMWMNFMDYSGDRFMNLFTQDQVNRMRAVFQPVGNVVDLLIIILN